MKCLWHLCTNEFEQEPFVKTRKFCSDKCKSKFFVTEYRREMKRKLVEYKGGKCEKCDYNRCIAALDFHHIDPTKKDFSLSFKGQSISFERAKLEVDKCQLLCANCHREVENNFCICQPNG